MRVILANLGILPLGKKIKMNKYASSTAFLADLQLMHNNSSLYNGPENEISKKAKTLIEIARQSLEQVRHHQESKNSHLGRALELGKGQS